MPTARRISSGRAPAALAVAVAMLSAACASSEPGVTVGAAEAASNGSIESTPTQGTKPEVTTPPTTPVISSVPTSADGVGDELLPSLGNPGVDVTHYGVELSYDPQTDTIDGEVTLQVLPTESRDEFTLDAVDVDIRSVTVGGASAEFAIEDPELRIRPAGGIEAGQAVEVIVAYTAQPQPRDRSGSGISSGWVHQRDSSYVLNEPDGARTWLPSNDHPSDKATYTFAITVPFGATAVANGTLVSSTESADTTTWTWDMPEPMTTYAIQLITGDYELIETTTPDGLLLSHAVLRGDVARMQTYFDITDDQIAFMEARLGGYPFANYGLAITDSVSGLAMEDTTRPLFSRDDFPGELGYEQQLLLAHELAHQWFGNAVSPARWRDLWLNESFATYMEWLWLDNAGLLDLPRKADAALAMRQTDGPATGDPNIDDLFGFQLYAGGAVVVHALRLEIGDDAFFRLLRTWVSKYADTAQTTEAFIAAASDIADRDLQPFFDEWLYATDLPDEFPAAATL